MHKELKLLITNLSSSPLIPNHYRAQALTALGGKVHLTDPTSKQGGSSTVLTSWEDGSHPVDVFSLDHLLSYCRRNDIFYVITPALNHKEISCYVSNMTKKIHTVQKGKTLEGTFVAALIKLRHNGKELLNG